MNLHLFYSFGFRRFRILRPRPTHARSTRRGAEGLGRATKKAAKAAFSGNAQDLNYLAAFSAAGFAVERVKRCLNLSTPLAVSTSSNSAPRVRPVSRSNA